jgi:hypothetical protein
MAHNFSVLLGDGDPSTEACNVEFFDLGGNLLLLETVTTTIEGDLVTFDGDFHFVKFSLLTPESGIALDNFSFTLGPRPVPIPTTMLLLGSGLIGLAGFRRRFKKA